MLKQYIVRLSDEESQTLQELVSRGKATTYKIKHANILLKKRFKFFAWKGLVLSAIIQLVLTFGFCLPVWAGEFHPDPLSVQYLSPAYRYPQAGWNVVHLEGEPYDRGLQHGKLLAPEIAAYIRAIATFYEPQAPTATWKVFCQLADALFLRGYSQEQLMEMKGIADGASAAGARFDGQPIKLTDIVALNSSNEIESLQASLQATSTGLESLDLNVQPSQPKPSTVISHWARKRTQRCSAFAAVAPATKDGRIVFGHITMFDLYPANFYNVWLDVRPSQGHHFVIQTFPGGIHSGMDYSINDAGILMSETTLDQTSFNAAGIPLGSRIRTATQYANSIDQAATILHTNSNGLSTSEWIIADLNLNEIALLTMGTYKHKLYRSSKHEWIADAPGFYWSDNNNKDSSVRLETIPGIQARPYASGVFSPSKRDTIWLQMYDRYKGKIDDDFARQVLTKPELVSAIAVDAKYTNSEMANQLSSWATFGPPVGAIWQPTVAEYRKFSEIEPLVTNPWTVITTKPPLASQKSLLTAADLFDPEDRKLPTADQQESDLPTIPAWHGTLLPKTDADIWLTTAFANYERIVSLGNTLDQQDDSAELEPSRDRLAIELFYYRSIYELGVRAGQDTPLAQTRSNFRDENWFRVASGKGVLLLHSLRGIIGAEVFDQLMDRFGRAHAGQEITVALFQSFMEEGTGKRLATFFDRWLQQPGLPHLELRNVDVRQKGKQWISTVTVARNKTSGALTVPITVETSRGETTALARLEQEQASVQVLSPEKPLRIYADKYGWTARSNGSPFIIFTFDSEVEKSLIVYGSMNEETTNHEAALVLQQALRRREHNIKPILKKDTEVTENDLKTHHLLLVGRPSTNSLVQRFQDLLPVSFGSGSMTIRNKAYAHPKSAVVMAIDNPFNQRFSVVVLAGLSSSSTFQMMRQFSEDSLSYAQVVLLPYNHNEVDLVSPARELVYTVQ